MRLSEAEKEIVRRIIREGRVELSIRSGADYIAAAAFVFDNGLLFDPSAGRRALEDQG